MSAKIDLSEMVMVKPNAKAKRRSLTRALNWLETNAESNDTMNVDANVLAYWCPDGKKWKPLCEHPLYVDRWYEKDTTPAIDQFERWLISELDRLAEFEEPIESEQDGLRFEPHLELFNPFAWFKTARDSNTLYRVAALAYDANGHINGIRLTGGRDMSFVTPKESSLWFNIPDSEGRIKPSDMTWNTVPTFDCEPVQSTTEEPDWSTFKSAPYYNS